MEIDRIFEGTFHNKQYEIGLSSSISSFSLQIHEKNSNNHWRGSFNSHYIEDLTLKTGNFKRFQVFTKMLISGLEKSTQSVIIDIITKEEFDKIRNEPRASKDPKLLFIMTYIVEFDKVHYPLSLQYCTSASLRKIHSLETDDLRAQLIELKTIKQEKDIMEKRYENMVTERDKEIYYLAKEKDELQSELDKIKRQMDTIIEQLEKQADLSMSKNEKREEELKVQKEKMEGEIERYRKEVKVLREESKKDKSRILQLESELKTLFQNSRNSRTKSISSSSNNLQKSYSAHRENDELNHKLSTLKLLLDKAKE
jgi:coiled-coil domain-containing protein 61